jgi:hypothetical protein
MPGIPPSGAEIARRERQHRVVLVHVIATSGGNDPAQLDMPHDIKVPEWQGQLSD